MFADTFSAGELAPKTVVDVVSIWEFVLFSFAGIARPLVGHGANWFLSRFGDSP